MCRKITQHTASKRWANNKNNKTFPAGYHFQVILNTGSVPTYRRYWQRNTILDISLADGRTLLRLENWKVIEPYTGYDYQYITFRVRHGRSAEMICVQSTVPGKWSIAKMDHGNRSMALVRVQHTI